MPTSGKLMPSLRGRDTVELDEVAVAVDRCPKR